MYVDIRKFSFYILFHSNIYSHDLINNEIEAKCTVNDQDYTLKVNFSKAIDKDDPEKFNFYAIFFKKIMKFLTFERANWQYYYRNSNTNFEAFKVRNSWSSFRKLSDDCHRLFDLKPKFLGIQKFISERWHRRPEFESKFGLKFKKIFK
jgi:hypothetical protein